MNLFVFHNDLRLHDNTALAAAIADAKTIPVFIFTPTQVGQQNPYRSQVAIDFMCNSLAELDAELRKHSSRLHTYYGNTHSVVAKLLREHDFKAVYSNANYTPFAIDRDKQVEKVCKAKKVEFHCIEDYALHPIGSVKTASGIYKKFTPYYNAVRGRKVHKPAKYQVRNLGKLSSGGSYKHPHKKYPLGGRKQGLAILTGINKFSHYSRDRNMLAKDTTQLSAYIKFGCISIREAYWACKKASADLVKQLIWRDFFMNIVWGYPHVLVGRNRNFKQKYSSVRWKRSGGSEFSRWCKGQTGYPIVDAAMRQLNETGWMHNRGRLIVAWFLTKVMGWHWELGEKYFATRLRDYDPAQNNGGWQFCAGSGVDTDQYFRQFNPWAHSEKYDPDAKYIKRWVPELAKVAPRDIHHWYKADRSGIKYPAPMIDYEKAKEKIKSVYGR